jgi:GTP-binding protein
MTRKAQYRTTVVDLRDLPPPSLPEVAIVGRSNAGKSSLINAMLGVRVAHTSSTPGKTRGLNFIEVGERYWIVDFPGYGYAQRSGSEVRAWQALIEGYFVDRAPLRGAVLVVDGARQWTGDEDQLVQFWLAQQVPFLVAVNKVDRFNQRERAQCEKRFKELGPQDLHFVSAETGEGVSALEERIFKSWVQPAKA